MSDTASHRWYRVMSPLLKIETRQVTYDEPKQQIFVEVVQEFHIRWSPFNPAPSRYVSLPAQQPKPWS